MVDPLSSATTSYTFDAASRLTGRTEANGIVTTVTYTGMDQLASKTEVAGSTTLASWTNVTYDLAQNRTGETLAYYSGNPYPDAQAGTATYKYDSLNQISQSAIPNQTTVTFGFDGAHNLTSNAGTTQTYNNNESLQTVGAATVGSDADGNQQKDIAGNTLSWNSLSQLEKFSISETYVYDALGRLTKVTNGSNVIQFVYRGLSGEVIEELNSSGTVIRSYSWDTIARQLYVKSGSNVYYQITNPHGDVAALASATALVGTEHFDAWGNPFTPSGTTTPFGFQGSQGSWTDSTTGFVSMGVRWYYPKVGRFLSSDPAAGTADPRTPMAGLRWVYALNSPLVNSDSSGLNCDDKGTCHTNCDVQACSVSLPVSPATSSTIYGAPSHPSTGRDDWYNDGPSSCNQACVNTAITNVKTIVTSQGAKQPDQCCDILRALGTLFNDATAAYQQDSVDFTIGFGGAALGAVESAPPVAAFIEGSKWFDPNSPERQEIGLLLNNGHPGWDSYQAAVNYQAATDQSGIISMVKNWQAHPFQFIGSATFVALTMRAAAELGPSSITKPVPSYYISAKVSKQMPVRSWTIYDVEAALRNPAGRTVTKTGRPATGYEHPAGGDVVRIDDDGTIQQVSDRNNPTWHRDPPWQKYP
jgi:RHS repeat-associated protein